MSDTGFLMSRLRPRRRRSVLPLPLSRDPIRALGAAVLLFPVPGVAQTEVRAATYNIRFLDVAELPTQGGRADSLKKVIRLLETDVIGLQEIDDRPALEAIFDPAEWQLVIDDDSGSNQDLAVAVRRPLEVVGFAAHLDADDEHFLFEEESHLWFPNRRDVLAVEVRLQAEDVTFMVLVHHAKARAGGRAATDFRREEASKRLVQALETEFHERDFVLLGDFNDAPDDRSLNILETGDPDAPAGPEDDQGPFLVNLTESLYAAGHVSFGRKNNDVHEGKIDTLDPEARDRNNDARGTDAHTGDQLFDQILIPVRMVPRYVLGSTQVFDVAAAALGNEETRASDHLPVVAEFLFGEEPPVVEEDGILQIVALLPNPVGEDAGNESVTIRNPGPSEASLDGCELRDRAENAFALPGTIAPGSDREIVMTTFSMPLNNSGDEVRLVCDEEVLHVVQYTREQVVEGATIEF